jgi:hypothetical protein
MQLTYFKAALIGGMAIWIVSMRTLGVDDKTQIEESRNPRLETVIVGNADGTVHFSTIIVRGDDRSESKFELAGKGDSYRLFVQKMDVWTWSSKIGYRLYRWNIEGKLVVFDPDERKMNIPDEVKKITK